MSTVNACQASPPLVKRSPSQTAAIPTRICPRQAGARAAARVSDNAALIKIEARRFVPSGRPRDSAKNEPHEHPGRQHAREHDHIGDAQEGTETTDAHPTQRNLTMTGQVKVDYG